MSATTTEPTGAAANPDAERIMLLARIVSLRQERDALDDADEWAPDTGPLHARYEETLRQEREAARRLFYLGAPETPPGVRLTARLALESAAGGARHHGIVRCDYFGDWLVMVALQGATGIREEIAAGGTLRHWLGEEETLEAEEGAPAEAMAEAQP